MRTYSSLRAPYLPSFPPCPTISRAYLATSAVFYPLAPVVHARHGLYVIRSLARKRERKGEGEGRIPRPTKKGMEKRAGRAQMVEHGGSISASFGNYEMVNLGKRLDFYRTLRIWK